MRVLAIILVSAAAAFPARCQELSTMGETSTARAESGKITAKSREGGKRQQPVWIQSGFGTELGRSTNVVRTLSLRQANDPKRDLENLLIDPKTGRAKGFVFWRLSF